MTDFANGKRSNSMRGRGAEVRAWLESLGALVLDRLPPQAGDQVVFPDGDRDILARRGRAAQGLDHCGASHTFVGEASILVPFDERPVLFVAAEQRQIVQYMLMFSALDMHCAVRVGFADAIAESFATPAKWACLVVDLDGFGGIGPTIDRLLALRRAVPDLPVILLSSDVVLNDYSTERLAITDVTLRKPTNVINFEIGVIEALDNNRVWQRRLAEYRRALKKPSLPPSRRRPRPRLVASDAGPAELQAQDGPESAAV